MMSSMKDDFQADAHKSPKELEREIDATRARMERTLDILERKLSPSEILDEVLGVARRNGGDFARNLSTQVKSNPLPTLLTGIGLVWLMTASDRPPKYYGDRDRSHALRDAKARAQGISEDVRDRAGSMADSTREHAGDIADSARNVADSARDTAHRVREKAQRAGERAHEMTDSVRETAANARDAAQRGGKRIRDEYQHLLREQPLLLGGLGLALGAALGAMAPRTETEDELLGEYSARLKREARQQGREQYQRTKETVERAAGAAKEEFRQQSSDGH
jgi:ElaB/YqjD/DUF883 family membrane-anchored ribosome-binding protein